MTRPNPKTRRMLLAIALGALGAATGVEAAASANSAAETCAKGLTADSRLIYDATVQNMKGPDSLRDTVTQQTKAMVMAGKLSRDNARPAAEAAGNCLKLLAKS